MKPIITKDGLIHQAKVTKEGGVSIFKGDIFTFDGEKVRDENGNEMKVIGGFAWEKRDET